MRKFLESKISNTPVQLLLSLGYPLWAIAKYFVASAGVVGDIDNLLSITDSFTFERRTVFSVYGAALLWFGFVILFLWQVRIDYTFFTHPAIPKHEKIKRSARLLLPSLFLLVGLGFAAIEIAWPLVRQFGITPTPDVLIVRCEHDMKTQPGMEDATKAFRDYLNPILKPAYNVHGGGQPGAEREPIIRTVDIALPGEPTCESSQQLALRAQVLYGARTTVIFPPVAHNPTAITQSDRLATTIALDPHGNASTSILPLPKEFALRGAAQQTDGERVIRELAAYTALTHGIQMLHQRDYLGAYAILGDSSQSDVKDVMDYLTNDSATADSDAKTNNAYVFGYARKAACQLASWQNSCTLLGSEPLSPTLSLRLERYKYTIAEDETSTRELTNLAYRAGMYVTTAEMYDSDEAVVDTAPNNKVLSDALTAFCGGEIPDRQRSPIDCNKKLDKNDRLRQHVLAMWIERLIDRCLRTVSGRCDYKHFADALELYIDQPTLHARFIRVRANIELLKLDEQSFGDYKGYDVCGARREQWPCVVKELLEIYGADNGHNLAIYELSRIDPTFLPADEPFRHIDRASIESEPNLPSNDGRAVVEWNRRSITLPIFEAVGAASPPNGTANLPISTPYPVTIHWNGTTPPTATQDLRMHVTFVDDNPNNDSYDDAPSVERPLLPPADIGPTMDYTTDITPLMELSDIGADGLFQIDNPQQEFDPRKCPGPPTEQLPSDALRTIKPKLVVRRILCLRVEAGTDRSLNHQSTMVRYQGDVRLALSEVEGAGNLGTRDEGLNYRKSGIPESLRLEDVSARDETSENYTYRCSRQGEQVQCSANLLFSMTLDQGDAGTSANEIEATTNNLVHLITTDQLSVTTGSGFEEVDTDIWVVEPDGRLGNAPRLLVQLTWPKTTATHYSIPLQFTQANQSTPIECGNCQIEVSFCPLNESERRQTTCALDEASSQRPAPRPRTEP